MLAVTLPERPAVDVIVTTGCAFVPPAVSVTVEGETEQPLPVTPVEQLRLTVPAKLLTEVIVRLLVFPVVAPEVRLSVLGEVAIVKEGGVTVTAIVAGTVMEPLVPVTTALKVPLLPGTVFTVTMLVPVPPEESDTGEVAEQVLPVVVPLAPVTAQVRATEPEKPFSEVRVTASVLPAVAPARTENDVLAGDRLKVGDVLITSDAVPVEVL